MAVLRPAASDDAQRICEIYNHFVAETVVTFEEQPVTEDQMERRISDLSVIGLPWLVKEVDGEIIGYACATPWKSRSAYRHSVESTIYLAPEFTGRGIGSELYRALIDELRTRTYHCAIGGIALPNAASIALHERLGFEKIGLFREVGWKLGRWVDVGYWELLL